MNGYIHSRTYDYTFFLTVGLWSTLIAFILNHYVDMTGYSDWYWLILVVAVDVSHVYSSLYRTYLSSDGRKEYGTLLIWAPALCFTCALALAYAGPSVFWRALVYVAVYHFIKQQVGFIRIYCKAKYTFDEFVIYIVTVGSILIWHLTSAKTIRWFIKDDFFTALPLSEGQKLLGISFLNFFILATMVFYVIRRCIQFEVRPFVLTFSTFVAWYFGIVVADSDFIFTFTNVVTHGVPYMALVWHTQNKENTVFAPLGVFFLILLVAGFVEEGFWDALVWREHSQFFDAFYDVGPLASRWGLAAGLALLTLPQFTHYVLDGYIWKTKGQKRSWTS